jgi:tricorn protease
VGRASPPPASAAFEARGDVFTVPKENGPVLNLTRSSGVADRYPRWSPDGRTVAY